MPALRNPKHEKFAQGIVKGRNGVDAYLKAGFKATRRSASVSAWRLLSRTDVQERIEELGGKAKRHIAREQVALAIKMGRPTLYREELCDMARRLALLGLKDSEIAEGMNIALNTLKEWKAEHPEFMTALQRGKLNADGKVAERAYHRALGYHHEAVKIFMPAGAEQPVYAPYTEHYPPDTTAAFKWLAKRQPRLWRDEETIRHTSTLEQRILAMTPEERAVEALALVERIKARLRQPDAQMIIENEGER
jgi:hypothetical protein